MVTEPNEAIALATAIANKITPPGPQGAPEVGNVEKVPQEFEINMIRCIFCGFCVDACPTDAIKHGHNFEWAVYTPGEMVKDKNYLLANKAREKKLGPADMQGGCFSISSLGGIGGTAFTPIINYPEVAILGLSRSAQQPVVKDGEVVPRLLLPLSLSYDHRVIDGADAARFTRLIAEMLENPWMMLLKG